MRPFAARRLSPVAILVVPLFAAMIGGCTRAATATSTASSAFADEGNGTPGAAPIPAATTAAAKDLGGDLPVASAAPFAAAPPSRGVPAKASAAPVTTPSVASAPPASTDGLGDSFGAGGLGSIGHGMSLGKSRPSAAGAMAVAPRAESFAGAFNGPAIAAGEWDDNANYHEFMRYLANEERLPIHRVNVSDRRFLVVRDALGKPVPRCRVTVTDGNQQQTTLTTMASGRAILFPHAEGLTTTNLVATASCPGGNGDANIASHAFSIDDQDGAVDLRLKSSRNLPQTRPVDVAFILDTTGSMGEEIDAVRTTIGKVAHELGRQNFTVRLGLVEYKDRGDAFVTKVHQFSSSSEAFLADVARVTAGGGGDLPESVNEGLHVGLTQLQWGQDSVARFAFLIGDAPPHLDYANDADYAVEMKRAAHDGVQLFTVAASGMDALGQAVFRQVAEYTGGTNLFVLRGGAGPQSTGAGDPKSSCGGTHTNYSSGNLDGLILAKITRELHAMDGDAMRIAGLYRDEDAKPCNERVAMAD